jgi:Tfp pilus assembly protein FimT
MVVIAIVGLMSTFSVSGYIASMPTRRLKAATRELYGVMQQARLIAVKENRSKRVRFGTDYYYFDDNNNKICDANEKRLYLSQYQDVAFGCGKAGNNWNGDPVSQTSLITFSSTGTANSRTAYLQNIVTPSECFAITSQTSGALKIRWFDGNNWK